MISPSLEAVTYNYTRHHPAAIRDVSFGINAGEVFCILGPSGSGKTTILKLFAGLLVPETGRVLFDDTDVSRVPPEARDAVMVFQNPLLFPFMTVGENVAFGLRMAKMPNGERISRVEETLEYVRLGGFAGRRINQLSGGQRQRVALARALALRPGLLLLDEPLSNLDEHLRDEMRDLICATRAAYDTTIVIVTHDRHDAATLSDRMAVVLDGRVRQVGRYGEILAAPESREVAEFLGNRNWISGAKREGEVRTDIGTFSLPDDDTPDGAVWISIRPEDLRPGKEGAFRLTGEVVRSVSYGSHSSSRVRVGAYDLDMTIPAGEPVPRGAIEASFDPAKIIIVPADSP
jgi:ABC-type Fe3+/spermidine/putrescine transport system ATPase subunit